MNKRVNIQILVGTVMGTALDAANIAAKYLGKSYQVELNSNFTAGDLGRAEIILVCTSNTGVGDIPANLQPFYFHLLQDLPRISEKQYAIINLGDSTYPSFGEAGQKIDLALSDIGAQKITHSLLLDASEGYDLEQSINQWLASWVQCL